MVDSTRVVSITANLGDTKTTLTHPASTTHGRISPEAREAPASAKACCVWRSGWSGGRPEGRSRPWLALIDG